jgi:hypothetical protein
MAPHPFAAFACSSRGRFEDALEANQDCAAIRATLFGEAHPATIAALNNTAYVQSKLGKLTEALDGFTHVKDLCAGLYGPQHERVADALSRCVRGCPWGAFR